MIMIIITIMTTTVTVTVAVAVAATVTATITITILIKLLKKVTAVEDPSMNLSWLDNLAWMNYWKLALESFVLYHSPFLNAGNYLKITTVALHCNFIVHLLYYGQGLTCHKCTTSKYITMQNTTNNVRLFIHVVISVVFTAFRFDFNLFFFVKMFAFLYHLDSDFEWLTVIILIKRLQVKKVIAKIFPRCFQNATLYVYKFLTENHRIYFCP